MKKYLYFLSSSSLFLPSLVLAQSFILGATNLQGVIMYLIGMFSVLNPILFSLAFIVFFWGLSKFIMNADSKDEIQKGKNYMVWGVIALFILITLRAILSFISYNLGFGNAVNVPYIPQG